MIIIDVNKQEDGTYKLITRQYYYTQELHYIDGEKIVTAEEFQKIQEKNNRVLEDF